MNYAKLKTGTIDAYPYILEQLRIDFPNVSFPKDIASCNLEDFNIVPVESTDQPVFNPSTHTVVEDIPVLDGTWKQVWNTAVLTPEELLAKANQEAKTIADKIETLWSAANAYTTGFISGVAIGILTIGVIQGKPKSLAVSAWSKVIWDEYYIRKAGITVDSHLNLDFSSFGPLPYTIPELSEEAVS